MHPGSQKHEAAFRPKIREESNGCDGSTDKQERQLPIIPDRSELPRERFHQGLAAIRERRGARTMTLLANIRRKRSSASTLGVVLFAWLGVLAAPCAMAFWPDASSSESVTVIEVHDHCTNAGSTQPMTSANCCCNLSALVSGDTPQLAKLVTLVALPIDFDPLKPMLLSAVLVVPQRSPLHATSPPVYLATQRLRI